MTERVEARTLGWGRETMQARDVAMVLAVTIAALAPRSARADGRSGEHPPTRACDDVEAPAPEARLHARRADDLLGVREANGSARQMQAAVRLAPCWPRFRVALGDAMWLAGRPHDAREAWAAALDLDAGDDVARRRLGEPVSYGGQILILDFFALGALVVPPLGGAMLLLGSPLVHVAHGRGGAALGSLALRIAAMASIVLSYFAFQFDPAVPYIVLGTTLGAFATATAIDALVLAWEHRDPEPPAWPDAR